ncbi:MAG: class D beta-lactamase [Bacteroidia bacterium]|nr:class D beta-lactamase [Bacteroidia bacterium]
MYKLLLSAFFFILTSWLDAQQIKVLTHSNSAVPYMSGDSLPDKTYVLSFDHNDTSLFLNFKTAPVANGSMATIMYPGLSSGNKSLVSLSPDTLFISSPCFAPAWPDTVFFRNIDKDKEPEMCLLMTVMPYCDAYLTKQYLLVYDNVFTLHNEKASMHQLAQQKKLNLLPRFQTSFFGFEFHRSPLFALRVQEHFNKIHPALPPVNRNDLNYLYDSIGVTGCFVMYDPQAEQYTYVNKDYKSVKMTPASTFKIFNSLVGLETGVIADKNFMLEWNKKKHSNAAWNKNHTLETAFQNSVVWYYQELARRVGPEKMKQWLDSCHYGNADTTGGIDKFWLSGKLRISPEEQVEFLKLFYYYRLPFSHRSIDIVKEIMVADVQPGYTVSGKTGWGDTETLQTGWYVGYVETGGKVYFFANLIYTENANNPHFADARKALAYRMLREMKVIAPATN